MKTGTLSRTAYSEARGFTLLELSISLGVIALLVAGLTGINYRSLTAAWQSRAAATRVLGSMGKARWLAITENREYGVTLWRRNADGLWHVSLLKREGIAWKAALSPVALPPVVVGVSFSGSSVKEFNPDGTSSSGFVVIRCSGGRIYRLTLTPAIGRIRIYREG